MQEIIFDALHRLDEGDLPDITHSSRRKVVARSPATSRFLASALPPGDLQVVPIKEFKGLDPELTLGLVSGVRCYPMLPGNLGEGVLIGLGGRFLGRLPPLTLQWSKLHHAGEGGWVSSEVGSRRPSWSGSSSRALRTSVPWRNLAKLEQYLQQEMPASDALGAQAVG
ncbi:MAG: hypothetical protein RMJ98_14335 [Myxococcales bacterium]|nr:hypothetical protein [Polyangiaceae bacterium]MDW8250471.1 hypothetical protein [Myxococcales bacterium]